MPDFNEFLASIDPNEMGNKINTVTPLQILQFENGGLSNNEVAVLQQIYQRAIRASVDISLLYLHAYHDWLKECL